MIDLRPHFHHLHWRPMPHSMGIPVASDWTDKAVDDPMFGIYKRCGLWSSSEADILFRVVSRANHGPWIDIGSHTAWTSCHIAAAGVEVDAVDHMYGVPEFLARAEENAQNCGLRESIAFFPMIADEYFRQMAPSARFAGCVVDGDHCSPLPLTDSINAEMHLLDTGVIILHDFIGRPVQEAVEYLIDELGFKCKVYWTPHMVACCWRGDFTPPDYTPDSSIDWDGVRSVMPKFPFHKAI